jgi:hypothetical protein
VPGLGQLVGTVSEPISGSRPTYLGPGQMPPLRPDAPCAGQALPDLSQRTAVAPPAATGRTQAFSPAQRRTALRLLERLRTRGEKATR